MMKNKTQMPFFVVLTIIILIVFVGAIMHYTAYVGFKFNSTLSSEWSNLGQYIGGVLSPLFGILAFWGVWYSILRQKSENDRILRENQIVKLIEMHSNTCNNIKILMIPNKEVFKQGKAAFKFLYDKHLTTYFQEIENDKNISYLADAQKIDNAFSKLYKVEGQNFGYYFRSLYYLIKYIDDSEGIDKEYYAKLARAQLSTSEIQLLMYNCLFVKGKGFKDLVTKYGLLNGIDETEMLSPKHKELYDADAYK